MGSKTSIVAIAVVANCCSAATDENAQTAQSHFNDIISWHGYECTIRIPSNSSSYLREIRIGRGVSWTMKGDTKTLGIPIQLPTEKFGRVKCAREMLTLKRGQDDVWEVTSHVSGLPECLPAILNNAQYADETLPKGATKRLDGAQSHKIVCCVQTEERFYAGNAPRVLFTIVDQSQTSADTDMKEQEWVPNSYRWEGYNCLICVPQDSHITSIRIGRCKRDSGTSAWIFQGGPNCLGIKIQRPNGLPLPRVKQGMSLRRGSGKSPLERSKNIWLAKPNTNLNVESTDHHPSKLKDKDAHDVTKREFVNADYVYDVPYGHWLTFEVPIARSSSRNFNFCIVDLPPGTVATPQPTPAPASQGMSEERHVRFKCDD